MASGETTTSWPEPRGSGLIRLAVLALTIAACVVLAVLFFGRPAAYTVNLRFVNAAQLVKGNVVDVGGANAGLVKGFEITPDGQAEVEIEVDERYAPLRVGTRAQIRSAGQTSVSGRYVQLMLPPENEAGEEIDDGGTIGIDRTTTNVDIDQFFAIFDPPTRRAIQDFYRGGRRQYAGRGEQANRGLLYLNPQLAASSRLFEELRHEPPVLERFLTDSSRFVTALSERRDDLSALIGNLNQTTRALGTEKAALAEAIERLPPFMRRANTTYVNLRGTLDELDPFVNASKPVARKLRPYLAELRPFAREAVPTVRDLRRTVRRPGAANDLFELQRTYPRLADIALETKRRSIDFGTGPRDVGVTRGAFPELSEALTRLHRDPGARPPLHARLRGLDGRLLPHRRLRRARQLLAGAALLQRLLAPGRVARRRSARPRDPGRVLQEPRPRQAGQALPRRGRGGGRGRFQRVLRGRAAGPRLS